MQHNNLCTCNGSDRESHVTDARTEENALQGNEQSTAAAQKASKKVLWQSATLLNVSCSFAGYHALKRLARVRSFSDVPLSSSDVALCHRTFFDAFCAAANPVILTAHSTELFAFARAH